MFINYQGSVHALDQDAEFPRTLCVTPIYGPLDYVTANSEANPTFCDTCAAKAIAPAPKAVSSKWEYCVEFATVIKTVPQIQEYLNILGEEDWELVSIERLEFGNRIFIFKRLKSRSATVSDSELGRARLSAIRN